jgi:hypothetical protein
VVFDGAVCEMGHHLKGHRDHLLFEQTP